MLCITNIFRFNEEEIRDLRVRYSQEKEDAVKVALELQKKALSEQRQVMQDSPGGALSPTFGRPTSGNSALIVKLQREIKSLRDTNRDVTTKYETLSEREAKLDQEIQVLRNQHHGAIVVNGDGSTGSNISGTSANVPTRINEGIQVDLLPNSITNSPVSDSGLSVNQGRTRTISCSSTQTINEEEREKVGH